MRCGHLFFFCRASLYVSKCWRFGLGFSWILSIIIWRLNPGSVVLEWYRNWLKYRWVATTDSVVSGIKKNLPSIWNGMTCGDTRILVDSSSYVKKEREYNRRTLFKGFVHGLVGSPDHFYGSGFGEGFSFNRMGLTWCYQDTRIEVWLVDDEFPVKYMCI